MRAQFAEYIDDDIVESFDDENGPLGPELAFVALQQLDWVAVGLVLRRQVQKRYEAAKRLEHGDEAIIATITANSSGRWAG